MANVQELQTAIGEMLVARRNAAYRKRDAGDPRNPFQAKIGLEREFYEASQSVRTYDLILKLLENETKREALKRMRPRGSRSPRRSTGWWTSTSEPG